MHQVCVASAHCRGKTGFFREAFRVMTSLLSRDKGRRQEELARQPASDRLRLEASSAWGRTGGHREPILPLAPGRLPWCEMGMCVLATTQILGGCFLSFAFARLRWSGERGLPFDGLWWQAKKLGEPVSDTLSWRGLRLRSPSQEGGGGSERPHRMWGHVPKGFA